MARSLLVTGAAGFIGANFVHYWLREHPEDRVTGYDALTYAGNRDNLAALADDPRFELVHADIRDESRLTWLLRDQAVDTLVHFAAESHVDRSISGPDAFIDTNIVGTHSLLKAAREVWLSGGGRPHRFHHVSTDEVYGSLAPGDPGFHEAQQYQPNSPYSASKAASDHLVRAYHHTYGLQVSTSNCSNNYGPFHFPEKLIPLCITNILRGRPLPVYGDGSNIRDWLYVEDHCRGIERVLNDGVVGECYNIGGNNERNLDAETSGDTLANLLTVSTAPG
jgi:dTDP-glucose 4,6-dehydratase